MKHLPISPRHQFAVRALRVSLLSAPLLLLLRLHSFFASAWVFSRHSLASIREESLSFARTSSLLFSFFFSESQTPPSFLFAYGVVLAWSRPTRKSICGLNPIQLRLFRTTDFRQDHLRLSSSSNSCNPWSKPRARSRRPRSGPSPSWARPTPKMLSSVGYFIYHSSLHSEAYFLY